MRDPFRVIIDVWGNKSEKNKENPISKGEISKDQTKELKNSSETTSSNDSKTETTKVASEKLNTDSLLNKADADVSNDVSNLPIKRSTKKSTKIYGIASTSAISSDDSLNSNTSSPSSSPSELSPKISIKTATKSQSILSVGDSENSSNKSGSSSSEGAKEDAKSSSKSKTSSYEEPPEITSETNSEGTSHLPVKKSLKASTMVLSNATRKLLRENLAKSLEEQSRNEKNVYKKGSIESTKESINIVSKSKKNEEKESEESSKTATKGTTRVVQIAPGSNVDRIKASSIAKQLALGVRTIVIDPGHGGRDPGASGYTKGVYEKDVVLSISKKLANKIKARLNCNVILTRSSDTYLTLEERTAIANTKSADLFISLHCNASNDSSLVGIETYYLNLATDERAINVAARENATSRKNISDLESILNDLMKNAKINESSRLSSVVQSNLYRGMAKKYSRIRNLGVKQAPFYVLLGASMPSILIETSFLSNPEECRRLTDSAYQNALCDSITDGIAKYIRETNPQRL
ncbi:MAG: N-acetylmuramoyl-L-alanine amidase [Desulfamplus sp.]|nr:N-acetylmuramoyl-L-alanine amidase [Desulfamplus sp.]